MLRKMMVMILMSTLLTVFGALAASGSDDTVYWTSQGDTWYHADRACSANEEACYPISAVAAAEFGKKPCALCTGNGAAASAQEAKQASVSKLSATERGGTWVFRVPKSILESISTEHGLDDIKANDLVNLAGKAASDVQEVRVAAPADDTLVLSLRVIDGDAYMVLRPGSAYSDKNPLKWRVEVFGRDLFLFDAQDRMLSGASNVLSSTPDVKKQDYSRVFEAVYGDLDIAVYRALGTSNIAVLHLDGAKEGDALTGMVRIDDDATGAPVSGYIANEKGVFCCVLTDAELSALKAGAVPVLDLSGESASDGNTIFLPDLALGAENGG